MTSIAHYWGDGFDFDRLHDAEMKFCLEYRRRTGKSPITKEKYGTIRYEMSELWMKQEDIKDFLDAIFITTMKYPDMYNEIVDDARDLMWAWNKVELEDFYGS